MNTRLANLRALLREHDLAALFISGLANRRYISGFSGSSGALLVTADVALIFTDSRYRIQVSREAPDFTLCEIPSPQLLPKLLARTSAELGLTQIGFEAEHLSVASHAEIVAAMHEHGAAQTELLATTGIVECLREVKDAAELATIRQAIAITDAALAAVLPQLQPDMSEKQAAWLLEVAMRERGADGVAFPIIVAAGPNAALPHARPSDGLLGTGRPIVIDMGARLAGYNADLTRTVVLGEPDERFWEVYTTVLQAQQHAIAHLRAGLLGLEADALARDLIAAAGYGDYFGHGLGHGIGMDVHEAPSLRRTAPGQEAPTLRAGSITSVEPGIYIEGWGGVRIEDLVLIQADGCEVLSQSPKLVRP